MLNTTWLGVRSVEQDNSPWVYKAFQRQWELNVNERKPQAAPAPPPLTLFNEGFTTKWSRVLTGRGCLTQAPVDLRSIHLGLNSVLQSSCFCIRKPIPISSIQRSVWSMFYRVFLEVLSSTHCVQLHRDAAQPTCLCHWGCTSTEITQENNPCAIPSYGGILVFIQQLNSCSNIDMRTNAREKKKTRISR